LDLCFLLYCYENKEVQLKEGRYKVWDLGYDLGDVEQTKTDTGVDVICFS